MASEDNFVKKQVRVGTGPIRFYFRTIFRIVIGILMIFLLWFTITFSISIYRANPGERIDVALEKLHIKGPAYELANLIFKSATLTPVAEGELGFSGTTATKEEAIGIRINEFKTGDTVRANTPILATAEMEVVQGAEDQDILLSFENACYLKDYTDAESPKEVDVSPTEMLIFAGEQNFIFNVRCEYIEGLSPNKTDTYKKIRFTPTFAYSQEVDWRPFVKDRRTSEDKKYSASWGLSKGPASLRIGSSETQPFHVGESYRYTLSIYLDKNWNGEIKEINYLQLDIPREITLLIDDKFCDFRREGNKYYIKEQKKQEANIDCSSKQTLLALAEGSIGTEIPRMGKAGVSFEQCIEKYKKSFKFSCPFIINEASQNAEKTQVTAKASYIYEMLATDSFTLTIPITEGVA